MDSFPGMQQDQVIVTSFRSAEELPGNTNDTMNSSNHQYGAVGQVETMLSIDSIGRPKTTGVNVTCHGVCYSVKEKRKKKVILKDV